MRHVWTLSGAGRAEPRASRLDSEWGAGGGATCVMSGLLRGSHMLSRHWWSAQAPLPGPGAEFMQPRFWS